MIGGDSMILCNYKGEDYFLSYVLLGQTRRSYQSKRSWQQTKLFVFSYFILILESMCRNIYIWETQTPIRPSSSPECHDGGTFRIWRLGRKIRQYPFVTGIWVIIFELELWGFSYRSTNEINAFFKNHLD